MAQYPIPCPSCGGLIHQSDSQCPCCRQTLNHAAPSWSQQVIYPKSKKYILLGGVLGLFGFFALLKGAIGLTLICAACMAIFLIQFATSSITLGEQGFTHKAFGRTHSYQWADIDAARGFYIVVQRRNFIKVNTFVAWNFAPTYQKSKITRAVSALFRSAEALLDPLGNDAKQLAILMTQYMRRARARSATQTANSWAEVQ